MDFLKKTIKLGSLYPTRDFSYISDTVKAFERTIGNKKSIGEIINIGSGYEVSIKNIVDILCKITNKSPNIVTEKNRVRPKKGEVFRLKANNIKAKKILNWKPMYSGKSGLIKGLKETVEWFSNTSNLERYKTDHYVK